MYFQRGVPCLVKKPRPTPVVRWCITSNPLRERFTYGEEGLITKSDILRAMNTGGIKFAENAYGCCGICCVINDHAFCLKTDSETFKEFEEKNSKEDIADIIAAIGNHDEGTGAPVSAIAAALILGDKSDVRYTRVRNRDFATFDIHDRVNFSVKESNLKFENENKDIVLNLTIDTEFCSVMDYFEIFMGRMIMCKKAAEFLGIRFRLRINGQKIL